MSLQRITICIALFSGTITLSEPASAQMFYASTPTATANLLPAPNYVVYSPNFMAWRSAGYYGGNWGPYYYNPPAMYPYTPATTIWPNSIPTYPPVVPRYYRRY